VQCDAEETEYPLKLKAKGTQCKGKALNHPGSCVGCTGPLILTARGYYTVPLPVHTRVMHQMVIFAIAGEFANIRYKCGC
jgi:hypothetical protein